jgi:hypothetical protein
MVKRTDRNRKGRFVRGNPGGPGRPPKPRPTPEVDYALATTEICTPDEWKAIVRKALAQAKAGDCRARDFLLRILLGSDPVTLSDTLDELQATLERVREHEKRLEWQKQTASNGQSQKANSGAVVDPAAEHADTAQLPQAAEQQPDDSVDQYLFNDDDA